MSVAALVGHEHVKPGRRERVQLMTPRVGAFREAVAEYHRWVRWVTCFEHAQVNPIHMSNASADVRRNCHGRILHDGDSALRIRAGLATACVASSLAWGH